MNGGEDDFWYVFARALVRASCSFSHVLFHVVLLHPPRTNVGATFAIAFVFRVAAFVVLKIISHSS
jgi:hypothetical protein